MSITAERGRLHASWRTSLGRRPATQRAGARLRDERPRVETSYVLLVHGARCAVRFQSLV